MAVAQAAETRSRLCLHWTGPNLPVWGTQGSHRYIRLDQNDLRQRGNTEVGIIKGPIWVWWPSRRER